MSQLPLTLTFDGSSASEVIDGLAASILRASELEALAEVRERLLDLGDFASELFRVDIESVPGGTGELRASLQLTEAGRHLATALGAGNVDLLVVKEALGHLGRSGDRGQGSNPESPNGESPAEPGGAA